MVKRSADFAIPKTAERRQMVDHFMSVEDDRLVGVGGEMSRLERLHLRMHRFTDVIQVDYYAGEAQESVVWVVRVL